MKDKKTLLIQHRVNSIDKLKEIPHHYGVEIDIRIYKDKFILNHEPFEDGISFDSFLENYNHKFLIVNMKCDGGEELIINKLKEKSIDNFFFLDSSIPKIINLIGLGVKNIAARYSSYEPIEFVMKFKGLIDWVWVDCFDRFELKKEDYDIIKKDFKICLVSPELEGHPKEKIEEFKILSEKMEIDAICTKFPSRWEK